MKPAVTSFSYFTSHKMSLVRPGSRPTGKVIQAGEGAAEALYSESTKKLIFKKSSTKFCHITFTRFSSMKQLFNMHQVDSSKTAFCRKKDPRSEFHSNRSFTEEFGLGWALDTVGTVGRSIAFQKKKTQTSAKQENSGRQ